MPDERRFSKTMRIDLIPNIPAEPADVERKRIVVGPPTRRHATRRPEPAEGDSRYDELLQSIYDAALITTPDGRIVDVNLRAVEFLLYPREEIHGMNVLALLSGADESLLRTLSENLENERFTLIQAYCVRKNGVSFPAEIAVNKLRLGTMHLCFFIRDVTIRKQSEEMLITEHIAIQNAANGIAVSDLRHRLEYVNPAVAHMWSYEKPEAMVGLDARALLADPAAAESMLRKVLDEQAPWAGEAKARAGDGREFEVQIQAAANRNSEGETVGTVFSFLDISDRKRAETAEREAERRRVMLESLGAACHHLGQPATILLANLGVIKNRLGECDTNVGEMVESCLAAVERLGGILRRLNAVNEYRTMSYLEDAGAKDGGPRILEI